MAIIEVFPGHPKAIRNAVALAKPGDVILVHRGVYHESVRIPSEKSNIRLVAERRHQAILDGNHVLTAAFELNRVAGVEIEGIKIRNYISRGINIVNGKSNRMIQNRISGIGGANDPVGIFDTNSVGNLMMMNTIERIGSAGTGTGILLDGTTGNWVIQNTLQHNEAHGIEVKNGRHGAIVGNRISRNKGDAILMNALDNNLIMDNHLYYNGANGVNGRSTNNIILNCKIRGNRKNGLLFASNYNFAGFNQIMDHHGSGIDVSSDFNDIQENRIEQNGKNGVLIHSPHMANFVYRNRLSNNQPHNIQDSGVNNNIVQNDSEE
ncbi:right-handed parallel beta-helix repeat-containing protein [Paenibacillus sp. LHD-117]|uniref:right-handed parallel beta-helix repeat-containing protein n=1 Tax=Paenibacillus sp. LHD-117 TaxID=3071412 RepID=UPI0027DF970D|nr:right-handed parallel beta-helix repeat-containing protein [Paenibacillus sp. LHD-117]MDQ6421255.1 right-handed parallel beta-helix repeat-containing protein [Paenibacillus sp. LHD-117]